MTSKTKTTATKEEAKPALVPKLRFPEFRGAEGWQNKLVGPYLEDCSGRVPSNTDLPVYSSTREGLKRQDAYFDGQILQNKNEYGVVPPGCFVYRHMSDDGLFKFNINETGGDIAVSKEYPVFTTKDLNPAFLLAKLNDGLDFKHFALSQKAGGTRTRLYFSRLCEWRTLLPTPAEQQKIAECLSSVDELIAAQARKLDALKTHKKGLMQQLFPREGETQPRLRFPEFQNAGEWVEKRLSALIDLISGMHLSPEDYSTSGEVPYFTGPSDFTNDLQTVTKWTKRAANVSQTDDTLITVKGSGVGEIWYSTLPEVALGRQLMAIRSKNGSSRFIFQFLLTKRSRFEDLGSGNLIPGLSRAVILELEACFPSPAEQQRIADCLTSLDDLIAAQTQKHEALKTHKKGLMQQLFPSPEEVEP
jgi:type I restriction enzyme S subunit